MQIIDYCVLFSTILVVILIGWLSGRKTRSTDSAKEYLLTEKGINRLQAGFSMAATDFGGSGLVGAIGYCYFVGISGVWWNLAADFTNTKEKGEQIRKEICPPDL